mmetsp:Transcript_125125/g.216257  ORF Transcript_125125/g.216257 Transcript_125125/m.216257 type:complete len:274 (+) Transcript_125125:82-903(+)
MAMVVHSFFALALAVLAFVPSIATDCKSEVFSEDGTDENAACFMQQHAAIKVNRHDHEVKMTDIQPKDKEKQKPTPTLIPGAGELGAFNPSTNGLTDWDKQFISDKYGGPFYDGQDKIPAFKSQGEVRKNIAMGDDDTTPPPAPTTAAPTKAATEAAAEEKKEAAPTAAPVVQAKKEGGDVCGGAGSGGSGKPGGHPHGALRLGLVHSHLPLLAGARREPLLLPKATDASAAWLGHCELDNMRLLQLSHHLISAESGGCHAAIWNCQGLPPHA